MEDEGDEVPDFDDVGVRAPQTCRRKVRKAINRILCGPCEHIVILTVFLLAILGYWQVSWFYFNNYIKGQIVEEEFEFMPDSATQRDFHDIRTREHLYRWMSQPFVNQIFQMEGNASVVDKAFLPADNMFLVGPVRLRAQHRAVTPCVHKTGPMMSGLVCYDGSAEDTTAKFGPYSYTQDADYWTFRGTLDVYNTGGYITYLHGTQLQVLDQIQALQDTNFLPESTKVLLIEFNLYSADLNVFSVVKLLLEFPLHGGIVPSFFFNIYKLNRYDTTLDVAVFTAQCLFVVWFAFKLIHHTVVFACELDMEGDPLSTEDKNEKKRKRKAADAVRNGCSRRGRRFLHYIGQIWNMIDFCVILCLIIAVSAQFVHGSWLFDVADQVDNMTTPTYIDIYKLFFLQSIADKALMVVGFMLFTKTIKFFTIFDKVYVYWMAVLYTLRVLVAFLTIYVFVTLAFALLSHMMFRYNVDGYYTLPVAYFTNFQVTFGNFAFSDWEVSDRYFARIFYVFYMTVVAVFLLNLIVSILSDAFVNRKEHILARRKKNRSEVLETFPKWMVTTYHWLFPEEEEKVKHEVEDENEMIQLEEISHTLNQIYLLQKDQLLSAAASRNNPTNGALPPIPRNVDWKPTPAPPATLPSPPAPAAPSTPAAPTGLPAPVEIQLVPPTPVFSDHQGDHHHHQHHTHAPHDHPHDHNHHHHDERHHDHGGVHHRGSHPDPLVPAPPPSDTVPAHVVDLPLAEIPAYIRHHPEVIHNHQPAPAPSPAPASALKSRDANGMRTSYASMAGSRTATSRAGEAAFNRPGFPYPFSYPGPDLGDEPGVDVVGGGGRRVATRGRSVRMQTQNEDGSSTTSLSDEDDENARISRRHARHQRSRR